MQQKNQIEKSVLEFTASSIAYQGEFLEKITIRWATHWQFSFVVIAVDLCARFVFFSLFFSTFILFYFIIFANARHWRMSSVWYVCVARVLFFLSVCRLFGVAGRCLFLLSSLSCLFHVLFMFCWLSAAFYIYIFFFFWFCCSFAKIDSIEIAKMHTQQILEFFIQVKERFESTIRSKTNDEFEPYSCILEGRLVWAF